MLESWFNGLTTSQLVFFEQHWRANGPSETPARAFIEALKRAREPQPTVRRQGPRKEVVNMKGHRIVVWRDPYTGRFVRRRRR